MFKIIMPHLLSILCILLAGLSSSSFFKELMALDFPVRIFWIVVTLCVVLWIYFIYWMFFTMLFDGDINRLVSRILSGIVLVLEG